MSIIQAKWYRAYDHTGELYPENWGVYITTNWPPPIEMKEQNIYKQRIDEADDMPENLKLVPIYLIGDSVGHMRQATEDVSNHVSRELTSKLKYQGIYCAMEQGALLEGIIRQIKTVNNNCKNMKQIFAPGDSQS